MEIGMPFADPATDETLVSLVLKWAKDAHPDYYAETLKVASRPTKFRAYLIRLVELRCESDPTWAKTVPLMVLEETRVIRRVKNPVTGDVYEFRGKKAAPRQWAFRELTLSKEEFQSLMAAKMALDCEWMD